MEVPWDESDSLCDDEEGSRPRQVTSVEPVVCTADDEMPQLPCLDHRQFRPLLLVVTYSTHASTTEADRMKVNPGLYIHTQMTESTQEIGYSPIICPFGSARFGYVK